MWVGVDVLLAVHMCIVCLIGSLREIYNHLPEYVFNHHCRRANINVIDNLQYNGIYQKLEKLIKN